MEHEKQVSRDLVAQATSLAGLVEYQGGAVVSRTIIDKKVGTVTLFAFDEGQGLSEHTVPYDALVCIVDGEAEITISARPLNQGSLSIQPNWY